MLSTLADDSITLHYQPIARCGGEVVGLEALIRWHHQPRGRSPEAFIPVSERSGLIAPLSRWALEEACRHAATWPRPLTLAVNVSPLQFETEADLPALVARILAESGLPVEQLELDLSEAALAHDPGRARAIMGRLRDAGVRLALDDFGAGNSSLSAIRDFPFTTIKLDRRITHKYASSASARSIAGIVIELAHERGMSVLAEGVERQVQLDLLAAASCDLAQGYLIGPPRPIEVYAGLTGAGHGPPIAAQATLQRHSA